MGWWWFGFLVPFRLSDLNVGFEGGSDQCGDVGIVLGGCCRSTSDRVVVVVGSGGGRPLWTVGSRRQGQTQGRCGFFQIKKDLTGNGGGQLGAHQSL